MQKVFKESARDLYLEAGYVEKCKLCGKTALQMPHYGCLPRKTLSGPNIHQINLLYNTDLSLTKADLHYPMRNGGRPKD